MNLFAIDANLLVMLHAVLEEGSATRAAKQLNVTQSAVSNALARLRELLGDPLVVRSGQGLVPTPKAQALAPLLANAVTQLQAALDGGVSFVPGTSTRTFVLCAADNHQSGEVPLVAERFAARLPCAKLRVVSPDFLTATDGLTTGEVDAAFFPQPAVQPGQHSEFLFVERGALVVRRDHPKVSRKMTPRLFNELKHIDVEISLGRTGVGHRVAERHWQQLGLKREVAIAVPHFTAAAMVAARTDFVAGLPHRIAKVFCNILPLRIVPATFLLPTIDMALVWHPRTHADPGANYFRSVILDALGMGPAPRAAMGA